MNPEYYEKQNLISQKILELTQQQNQAQEQLAQLDFAPRLLELKQGLNDKDYQISNLEDLLKEKQNSVSS